MAEHAMFYAIFAIAGASAGLGRILRMPAKNWGWKSIIASAVSGALFSLMVIGLKFHSVVITDPWFCFATSIAVGLFQPEVVKIFQSILKQYYEGKGND